MCMGKNIRKNEIQPKCIEHPLVPMFKIIVLVF